MAKKWETLRAKMTPERREANRLAAEEMVEAMPLEELRTARNITQTHLASLLRITQASVSKMEKRTDMYVSTLRSFVQAMGASWRSGRSFRKARCGSISLPSSPRARSTHLKHESFAAAQQQSNRGQHGLTSPRFPLQPAKGT